MSHLSIIVIIILKLRKGKVKYFLAAFRRLKNVSSEEKEGEKKIHIYAL